MISDFIERVKIGGLARTNRYLVTIGQPNGFVYPMETRLAGLFCDGAQLPGMNIDSTPHKVFGESREMPYGISYNPLNLNFYVDADMKLRKFFDKWFEKIVDPVSKSISYYDEYTTTITIEVLDVTDRVTYRVELIEAWPKSIGEIMMGYESRDPMKLPVTFQYKNWRHKDLSGDTGYTGVLADGSGFTGVV